MTRHVCMSLGLKDLHQFKFKLEKKFKKKQRWVQRRNKKNCTFAKATDMDKMVVFSLKMTFETISGPIPSKPYLLVNLHTCMSYIRKDILQRAWKLGMLLGL